MRGVLYAVHFCMRLCAHTRIRILLVLKNSCAYSIRAYAFFKKRPLGGRIISQVGHRGTWPIHRAPIGALQGHYRDRGKQGQGDKSLMPLQGLIKYQQGPYRKKLDVYHKFLREESKVLFSRNKLSTANCNILNQPPQYANISCPIQSFNHTSNVSNNIMKASLYGFGYLIVLCRTFFLFY